MLWLEPCAEWRRELPMRIYAVTWILRCLLLRCCLSQDGGHQWCLTRYLEDSCCSNQTYQDWSTSRKPIKFCTRGLEIHVVSWVAQTDTGWPKSSWLCISGTISLRAHTPIHHVERTLKLPKKEAPVMMEHNPSHTLLDYAIRPQLQGSRQSLKVYNPLSDYAGAGW